METCAECGKPIMMNEPSYYRRDPSGGDFGKTYHSGCGDPFGTKAKDAEIARLREALEKIRNSAAVLGYHTRQVQALQSIAQEALRK